jgi:hypothetical protein
MVIVGHLEICLCLWFACARWQLSVVAAGERTSVDAASDIAKIILFFGVT